MLRPLAVKMGIAVRKNVGAVDTVDNADCPPGIARQSRVSRRIYLPRAHALADRKARRLVDRAVERTACRNDGSHLIRGQGRRPFG